MPSELYCLSLINYAGNLQAGISSDGLSNWSHFQEPAEEPISPTPGFVEIDGMQTSSSPSVTCLDGTLFMAFLGHSDNDLYLGTSSDGTIWTTTKIPGQKARLSPFLSAMPYSPTLWLAYPGLSHEIHLSLSNDLGTTWTTNAIGQTSPSAPSILYIGADEGSETPEQNVDFIMVFQSNDSSNNLLLCTSNDNGATWQRVSNVGQQSQAAPSLSYGIGNDYGGNFSLAFLANDSSNEILVCSSIGGISWGGAVHTGHYARSAPQLLLYNNVLYIYFLGLNDDNIYVIRSGDGINWSEYEEHRICPGYAGPAVTPATLTPAPSLVWPPALPSGLGDNNNYIFYNINNSKCDHLLNVSVTIDIKHNLSVAATSAPPDGCGWQLNAYAPSGYVNSAWQQFALIYTINAGATAGGTLSYQIENWPLSSVQASPTTPSTYDLFNSGAVQLCTITEAYLPAGTKMTISLDMDESDRVVSATFDVHYDGTKYSSGVVKFTSIALSHPTGTRLNADESDFAPIIGFEIDMVGTNGAHNTTFTTGSGTFNYSALSLMTPQVGLNNCTETRKNLTTGETSNSTYGAVPSAPSTTFSQSFNVT